MEEIFTLLRQAGAHQYGGEPVNQLQHALFLGIDDRDFVGLISRGQEIAMRGVPSAVVKETCGIQGNDF